MVQARSYRELAYVNGSERETGVVMVRRAVPGDEQAVAGVHVDSWQVAYRGLIPDAYLDGLDPVERAKRYAFGTDGADTPLTTVAVDQEGICGFATVGPARDPDSEGVGELYAIYVDPRRWGRGAGQALLVAARRLLAERGYGEAALWVLFGNCRAERFYRADGWRPDGSRRQQKIGVSWGPHGGVVVDEVRYRRSLP